MTNRRTKLHPSSCFPPNPPAVNIKNRLFIRVAPNHVRHVRSRLTFIGVNSTTYSAIAALLASRPSASIECIHVFDACAKSASRATLNDLQLVALLNKTNIQLRWAQSYWETKDSTVVIINVQHHQLDNESLSTWTQMNASLVEDIVSQVSIHSPRATLIICTQPNGLMTYVAWQASGFPSERILGLGASVETAYAHRTILDQMLHVHGRIHGYFIIGSGEANRPCARVLSDHLTTDGVACSDIQSKFTDNQMQKRTREEQSVSRKNKLKELNLVKSLENGANLYSDISRRPPIISDLASRQKTAIKHLSSYSPPPHSESKSQQSVAISRSTKVRSNWTEAMLIAHLIRAVINNHEFQSNFAVNIGAISNSHEIFANYPTIIGSYLGAIKYMLPFRSAQQILQERLFLIPIEKSQRKLRLLKSKD